MREGLGTRIDEANSHKDTRSQRFEAAKLSDCEGLGVAAIFDESELDRSFLLLLLRAEFWHIVEIW